MKYLLIALFLVGCSHADQSETEKEFSKDSMYVAMERFSKEFGIEITSTISFSDDPYNGFPGYCIVETGFISINKEWWVDVDEEEREALIFHELGHCELGLGHTEKPGIMNGFIGFTAYHYIYEYEASVANMKEEYAGLDR